MVNKAHSAVINRLLLRYGGERGIDGVVDVRTPELLIAVETEATMAEGLSQLSALSGKRFIAGTNNDAAREALKQVAGTPIGVMSPRGDILKDADNGELPPEST